MPDPPTPRPLRADAARNHERVLDAAAALIADSGPGHVTLERVADAAGVGKGTVQRRFGTRAGLLQALLERRAERIRAGLAGTPAPLGSDAPPRTRLIALLEALGRLAADNVSLLAEHEQACATDKYADPTYRTWHRYLVELVAELNPALDADGVAHLLLATIDGRLVRHIDSAGTPGRFRDVLVALATAAADEPTDPRVRPAADRPTSS